MAHYYTLYLFMIYWTFITHIIVTFTFHIHAYNPHAYLYYICIIAHLQYLTRHISLLIVALDPLASSPFD